MNYFKFCQSETHSQNQINTLTLMQAGNLNKGEQEQNNINIPVYFSTKSKNEKELNQQIKQNRLSKTITNSNFICQCKPPNTNENNISGEVVIINKKTNLPVYEGEYFRSQKNGYGIQYDQKGQILYQGEFRDGKRQGWGKTKQYEGQFRQDDHDGWGRYITSHVFYEGYFTQGRYNGIGIQIQAQEEFKNLDQLLNKKTKIDEFFISQLRKDDSNIFQRFGIAEIYIGQWAKGQKNGSGKLWKQNGQWYTGQFSYGTIHGTGAHFKGKSQPSIQKGVFTKGQFKTSI